MKIWTFLFLVLILAPLAALAKSDDISSTEAIIYYAKSTKYVDLRDYKSQLHYLKKAVDLAPDSSPLQTDLGYAYANLNQYGTALKYLDKALKLDPNNKEALSRRAYISLLKTTCQKPLPTSAAI
jgi:Tetratricopeptide repeat.